MLVEHYPTDKRFEQLLGYMPELSPALRKIDEYLEDEKLYKLIRADLAKRYPKTKETGRNSTPVDVVLRMLVGTVLLSGGVLGLAPFPRTVNSEVHTTTISAKQKSGIPGEGSPAQPCVPWY